jgi:hypothetical protein
MRFLLVHSPVVGPSTWWWVADALRAAGHAVVVPDLRDLAATGDPQAVITGAIEANLAAGPLGADGHVIVVGHSGAGVLLPSIATAVDAPYRSLVFVDAGIPPYEGATSIGGAFLDHLRSMADDGLVPPWSTWWGDDAMAELVPDAERRAILETQVRATPIELFETPIDVPALWYEISSSYVLLGEPYRRDANTAAAWGWPVVERLGGHLDIVTEPEAIARAIVDIIR